MKKSTITPDELKQLQLLQENKNHELLKRFILDQTESKVIDKFSDKHLDTEIEKRRLLTSIDDFWRIKNLEGQIHKAPADYKSIFTQDFYKQIYRLNGWSYDGIISQKKWKVGRYTNEIIYYRFSHEVLPFLRIINPYVLPGIRRFKHHQYLTVGSRLELEKFINEAVELMVICNDWNDFRIRYCTMYNVPYQLKLF